MLKTLVMLIMLIIFWGRGQDPPELLTLLTLLTLPAF